MTKGQATKTKILQQAAELFNQQGYAGSSIADLMRVTGLQKGGIYNHFQSKDDLALAAFDYAIDQIRQRQWATLRGQRHACDRLQSIINGFLCYLDDPPIPGGCPLMNTAIESDDAHPALRDRAQNAMTQWHQLLSRIATIGITKGEIVATSKADVIATVIIATLEGAIMLSKLYGDTVHLETAIAHLNDYIDQQRT